MRRSQVGVSIPLVLAVAALIGTAVSCKESNTITGNNSSAAIPTPPAATPTPAPASHTNTWDVTDRVVGDSGPDFCIHTARVGSVYYGTYTILRNGSTVSFTPADVVDWASYKGTLQDTSFTASNAPEENGPANGMCAHYFQSSTLNGTFSPDGNHLTATETWSFGLDSGQVKTLTFQWSAVRR